MAAQRRITEPQALKALSHPIRLAIVDVLALERRATATRCAEVIGESVASCSYHLGMLAKYDFVVPAEGGQGREKPWKLADDSRSWGLDDARDDESALAIETLSAVHVDHMAGLMKEYLRRASREDPRWRTHTGSWDSTNYLTADELAELAAELHAVTMRYRDRTLDPALRPPGSRPVRIYLSTWLARPPEEITP